jgi:hypothetical protein
LEQLDARFLDTVTNMVESLKVRVKWVFRIHRLIVWLSNDWMQTCRKKWFSLFYIISYFSFD